MHECLAMQLINNWVVGSNNGDNRTEITHHTQCKLHTCKFKQFILCTQRGQTSKAKLMRQNCSLPSSTIDTGERQTCGNYQYQYKQYFQSPTSRRVRSMSSVIKIDSIRVNGYVLCAEAHSTCFHHTKQTDLPAQRTL